MFGDVKKRALDTSDTRIVQQARPFYRLSYTHLWVNGSVIRGDYNTIEGNDNIILGDRNIVHGSANEIWGEGNTEQGRGNVFYSTKQATSSGPTHKLPLVHVPHVTLNVVGFDCQPTPAVPK